MEVSKSQCPKCTGLMERGFVMDHGLIDHRLVRWVEGEPEIGGPTGLKLIERKTSQITRTDKCDKCGFLEFYGSNEVQYV
jgi:predicted nucleic-acid-binding Zn-ribbon protein